MLSKIENAIITLSVVIAAALVIGYPFFLKATDTPENYKSSFIEYVNRNR